MSREMDIKITYRLGCITASTLKGLARVLLARLGPLSILSVVDCCSPDSPKADLPNIPFGFFRRSIYFSCPFLVMCLAWTTTHSLLATWPCAILGRTERRPHSQWMEKGLPSKDSDMGKQKPVLERKLFWGITSPIADMGVFRNA